MKRGVGFLRSCNAMTNFTGEIVIENGVLMADLSGDLGPFDSKLAPTVTVTRTGTVWFTGSQKRKACCPGPNVVHWPAEIFGKIWA